MGWILLPIILAGAVSILAYTDVLARIGVGEIAAGFGLGAGPVIGSALVQGGGWSVAAAADRQLVAMPWRSAITSAGAAQ